MPRVTPATRTAAVARILDGEDQAAVADELGIPRGTVRTWLKRARDASPLTRQAIPIAPPPRASISSGVRYVLAPDSTAADAVGALSSGARVCGITRGQFSMIDILRAVLEQTGPADVVISTWTTGIKDIDACLWLVDSGAINSLRFLTDRSFVARQSAYAAAMVKAFGSGAVVVSKTHAKFATVSAPGLSVAIRSSMNLNRNPRFEQFDIDCSAAMVAFFLGFADAMAAECPEGFTFSNAQIEASFNAVIGGQDWREVGAGGGAPLPSSPLTVRLSSEERAKCQRQADADGLPLLAWIRNVSLWACDDS